MSGLWERLKPDATDRINVHLVVAGIKGYSANIFTGQQVIDALNRHVQTPLTVAEKADLTNITAQITAQGTVTAKLVYVVGKLEPVMVAAETGDCTEAFWRSTLGIV